MIFNELNSVEHFIIHNLTGVNLNNVQAGMVKEEPVGSDHFDWGGQNRFGYPNHRHLQFR